MVAVLLILCLFYKYKQQPPLNLSALGGRLANAQMPFSRFWNDDKKRINFSLFLIMLRHVRHGVKKLYAAIALLSIEIIIVIGVFSAALFAFISIANMIFKEHNEDFDQHAFNFLSKNISDANTDVMQVFTFLGTHTFLIPANLALVAWFLFIKKHRWYSISVPVVALSSLLLMFFLKMIFHRDRPV